MSESLSAELAHWQARCDEMQVALERVREQRDEWEATCQTQGSILNLQEKEIAQLRSVVSRIQVAMSQGQEL